MAGRQRVARYQQNGFVTVDPDATRGATIGESLFDTDGSVVSWSTILARVGAVAPDDGGAPATEVYWRVIREVPANVVALANTSTTGLYVVTDANGGSTTREIEVAAGELTVANGDGVADNPTLGLADVTDSGAGEILGLERDDKGRVSGTRAVTTDDLTEGVANLWFTGERAQDAVGTILADTVTIEFTYDDAGNLITADLSGLVLASLAAADSALQPGDNVSELANDAGYLEDAPSDGKIYGRKDGAWEEVASAPSGTWELADLTNPPEVWFDADVDAALVTTANAGSNVVTAMVSQFNAGTYSGTPGGTGLIWQRVNPKFSGRGSVYFPGTTNNRLTVTGGTALGQNVAGLTLIILCAFRNDSVTLANAGAGIIYVGTPTPDSSRAALLKSSSVNNMARATGRKADADAADGNDFGGNAGTMPVLYIVEFDYAGAAKRAWENGEQTLNDTAFQTPGTSANTASDLVCFGSASTGFWGEFEMQCGGIAQRVYATGDRQKIEGRIMHDNGIAHLLPVGHPYRDAPP
jgi:YD repeat-containing protein